MFRVKAREHLHVIHIGRFHSLHFSQVTKHLSGRLRPTLIERSEGVMSGEKGESEMQRSKSKRSYEFDDLLAMVGGFGRYTFFLYAFLCIMSLPIGLQQLVQVFYGATPKYSCVSLSPQGNNTCKAGTCCENCTEYEYTGRLTSAVTEVRIVLYPNNCLTTRSNKQ